MKMGALVLDAKAKLARGTLFSKFGHLLELRHGARRCGFTL